LNEAKPPSPASRTPRWKRAALVAAVFALALLATALSRSRAFEGRLNSDEPEWIAISILHWRQFVLREPPAGAEIDPQSADEPSPWKRGVQRTTFGYMNPCLPKLVWGAVLHATGHRKASPYTFQVFQRLDPAAGRGAQASLVAAERPARAVVIAMSALGAALITFAAAAAHGGRRAWLAGALAMALWVASPLVRETSSYVRTDHFMLPFCIGALVLALRRVPAMSGELGSRAQIVLGAALGLLCGFAASSKLNGALIGVAIAAWMLPAARRGGSALRAAALSLVLAVALAFAVFFALNPRLWSGPVDGVRDVLARWDKLIAYFQDELAPQTGVEVARTLGERASLFARKTFVRDDALGALLHPALGAAAALGGAIVLGLRALRGDHRAWTALAFALVFVAGTVAWLPLDWPRFYLTATPALVLLEALALAALVERLVQRTRIRNAMPAGDVPAGSDSRSANPDAGSYS
jgi:hypothetical protein